MIRVPRMCLALLLAAGLLAQRATAEEPLVPEGETPEILQGVVWTPMWGVRAVASSPDGTLFASVSDDGTLRLWDVNGRLIRRFANVKGGQTAVAFSGDSRVVVSGGHDGSLQAWDTTTGRDVGHLDGAGAPVAFIAVNADGHTVVFAGVHRPAQLWHPGDKAEPLAGAENAGEARAAQFGGPTGKILAVGLASKSLLLLDVEGHKALRPPLSGFAAAPTAVTFSPDGQTLTVGTENGAVHVVSMGDGKVLRTVEAHSQAVTGLRYLIDGVLATSAADGSVRIWNPASGQELHHLTAEACCASLAAIQGGRTLVSATPSRLLWWDVSSGAALPAIVGPASPGVAVATDSAGQLVLSAVADGSVRLFSLATGTPKQHWSLPTSPTAAALSGDGKVVAVAADRTVSVFESESGKLIGTLDGHEATVHALQLSGDGSRLFSGSADRTVRVWEVKSGKQLLQASVGASVTALALSADGATFATATPSGVRLWSAEHATETKRLALDDEPTAVAFAKDGKRVVVGLADGSVRLFDAQSGAQVSRFTGHKERVTGVAFTADGKKVVSAAKDGTMRLWNIDGATEAAKLEGLALGAAALSSSDTVAAAIAGDGATHVWNLGDQATRLVIRQAAAGWLSAGKDRVLRGDEGRWVLRAEGENGPLQAVPPKATATSSAPDLSLEVEGVATVVEGGRPGKVTLRVKNSGNGRAFWVKVVPSAGVPNGMTLLPSETIARVDAGASEELTIDAAWISRDGEPASHDEKLQLKVVSVQGEGGTPTPVSLRVRAAKVDVQVLGIDGDSKAPFVRLRIANHGDEATGPLTLTPTFVKGAQTIGTAATLELKDLNPGDELVVGVAMPPEAAQAKADLKLVATGTHWPTYHWTNTVPLQRQLPWTWIAGAIAGLLLLILLVALLRILRHPFVLQVAKDPGELRRYNISSLPAVNVALSRAGRLNVALTGAKIAPTRWKRAVAAGTSADEAAAAFAEAIGARRTGTPVQAGHDAWLLELPMLDIRFPRQTALVVCTGAQLESGGAASLATALHANGQGPTAVLALDLTSEQNAKAVLQTLPRLSFVVLSAGETRDLLYAEEPLPVLQKYISAQRPVAELSPYQSSSGLEEDGLFFGREKELRAIADRVLHNFIIVAPRQMGKSSLLKAVHRRLSARADVEVHQISLFEDDLASRVARVLNRPKPETADQFVDMAGGSRRKPRVWLVDEADSFIVKDARNKYPLAQAMRTLSEEGRGYFILAGFWHLYAAAFLNPNNPLRNFGEMLRLEPLDRDAARQLATKPMQALGIDYENDVLVERMLDQTNCRAHLITAVCKGIIEGLGPNDRVITDSHLEAGLFRNPALADEFKYWRREPLGRAVVRAALLGGPATRGELRNRLSKHGLEVPTESFAATLDRLELGYLLVPNADGKLICPVPLMVRFIQQEDTLEAGIQRDVRDFLSSQSGAAEGRAATG